MFLTTAVIAGASLYIGKRLYDQQRHRNQFIHLLTDTAQSDTLTSRPISQKLQGLIDPLMNSVRKQHLQEITGVVKSDQEKIVDRSLIIALMMFSTSMVGTLVYWPINLLLLPGLVIIAHPIYRTAYQGLVNERRIQIEVADSIAITVMFATGHFVIGSVGAVFYFGAKKLLIKTEDHSKQKLVQIMDEQPQTVWILVDGIEVQVPFEQVQSGDTLLLSAGQTIPVDGFLVAGQATIDERMLTGESQPIEKAIGDRCFAATLVLAGRIAVAVEQAGHETVAARIGEMLHQTIDFKEIMVSRGQKLADQSALPMILLGSCSVPLVGLIGGVTVLNSSFGYSLRMVSPIMMLNFLTIASQAGILIKDGRSLERLSQIDMVVFDKTGTLTMDQPQVERIHPIHTLSEDQVLTYAAAAEYKQNHPIALALLQAAAARQLHLPTPDDVVYSLGYGLNARLHGDTIHVGSARFMEMIGLAIPPILQTLAAYVHQDGSSLVYVAVNEQLVGAIELQPTIRPEAQRIINALRARNITLAILSGDHEQPTRRLAEQLGIETYFAEVLPEDKAAIITTLQQQKKTVCFIGDGINDSIALKKADVSISLRGAATIATDMAQIVLMNGTLDQLDLLFDMGDQFHNRMNINVLTSILPSIVTIGGVFLFGFGIAAGILSNQIGMLVGAGNSMLPLLTYHKQHHLRNHIECPQHHSEIASTYLSALPLS